VHPGALYEDGLIVASWLFHAFRRGCFFFGFHPLQK
jgi:hypothetical protein